MPAPSSSKYQVSVLPLKVNPVEERIPPATTPDVLAKCPECGLNNAFLKYRLYFVEVNIVGAKSFLILMTFY